MNRETRRKLKLSKDEGNLADLLSRWNNCKNDISAGDKVKINFEQISKRPDYPKMNEKYRMFVEGNKDTLFTAGVGLNEGTARNLIPLQEDGTWLFWCGDLVKI